MLKTKKLLIALMLLIAVLLIPNMVSAAVEYTRNFPSNDGTIEINLTGLELSDSKQYEFALVSRGGEPETDSWNLITSYTESTAKLVLSSGTEKIVNVLKVADEGQIFVREKDNTEEYVVNRLAVNLKLPYLQSLMYKDSNNKYYLHESKLYGAIGNVQTWDGDNTYIQWKKVQDVTLITKFLEIKNSDGSISQLESYLPTCPIDNWSPNKEVEYKNKNDGLYLLWVKRTGENCKEVYSCIIHDGLPDATTVEEYLGETESDTRVVSVSLPSTKTVKLGETLPLTPTFNPENATNKIVTWESSDKTVATVDNAGKVTPIKVGSTIITVTSQDGNKKATCTVTVVEEKEKEKENDKKIAVESVLLSSSETIELGKTKTLTLTFNPTTATNKNVKWTSSDEKIATVDENGKITPKKAGKVTITVTTEDGDKTATCEITVKDPTIAKDNHPNTGKVVLIWIIGIVAVAGIVAHIRYKKLYM